jgi:HSP20 family protein
MYHFELKPFGAFAARNEETVYSPAFEIADQEKQFSISLDIPGLKREDIDIEVKDFELTVTGERKTTDKNVVRSNKSFGKFSKVFTLPKNVNTDAIEAHFENGVLDLILPKEEKSQTKKISISGLS